MAKKKPAKKTAKKAAPKAKKKAAPKKKAAAKKAAPKAKKSAKGKPTRGISAKPKGNSPAKKSVPPEVAMALTHPLSTPRPHLNIVGAKPEPEAAEKLKAGDKAPAFSLMTDEGKTVSLASLSGKKVVLYFYPKDDTPGCTKESCDFRDSLNRVTKSDAVVYGISKDSVESHKKFREKFMLNFPLLSDPTGKTCEDYGVWKEKSMYGRKYMGIERMTFLIGKDGRIKKVYPKVKVEGHVDQVIADLATI